MEVPRKRAKTCPGGDLKDDGGASATAAQQIAELQAELDKCKRENIAAEERHDQVVRNLKGSYSDALEWAHSAKTVPRDHWLEKGHTEEYADAMEELLDTFKHIIKELRKGTVGARFPVQFKLQDDDDHRVTADHDAALMPYWKELANALLHWSQYHANEETLGLSFFGIDTPDAVLDVLNPVIKQSNVESFGLVSDGRPKTWKFAEFIEDIIMTNHKMTGVGFKNVVLSNEEWTSICDVIRMNAQASAMHRIQLTECFVDGMTTDVLKGILTTNLAELRLDGNGMSSLEASVIAEHLNFNPSLARLHLCDNRFDNNDAAVLANSLSSNTNLRSLNVGGNNVTEEGRLSFLRAIFDVTSLASCAASNHNCQVAGLEQDISALNCCVEASDNKWEKIFAMLALSSQDSFINTALLSGVPASLMPVLLDQAGVQIEEGDSHITDLYLELSGAGRSQKHDDWDNPRHARLLSCVYELIRSWVVPSIYV